MNTYYCVCLSYLTTTNLFAYDKHGFLLVSFLQLIVSVECQFFEGMFLFVISDSTFNDVDDFILDSDGTLSPGSSL